jgi:hypothetical protein
VPELIDRLPNVVTGDVAAAKRDLAAAREAFLACHSDENLRRWNAALMRVYLASAGVVDEAHERKEREAFDAKLADRFE